MKILMWGAGQDGVLLDRLHRLYKHIYSDEVVGVVDSDPRKQGSFIFDKKIDAPSNIFKTDWDKIIVASRNYGAEIRKKLIADYKISADDILTWQDYRYGNLIRYQYETNLKRNEASGKCDGYKPFNKNSLAVYTTIIGDYDKLKTPAIVEPNVRYICFTDQKNIESDVWEIRYIDETPEYDRARRVREYKMLPHKFLSEYESSIWVDASLKIVGKLTELIEKYQKHSNFLLFPHNERICAYGEASGVILDYLAPRQITISQIKKYLKENFPPDNGLMVGGFLARNHGDKKVISAMEDWYDEICLFSKRDQISLPYAVWKNKLSYDLCDLYYANNPWLLWAGHKNAKDGRGTDKFIGERGSQFA